ncbi:MAG: acetyl-CoA carboxylase biotin carboxyl carrier protein [Kiloniellaceae bacterium]
MAKFEPDDELIRRLAALLEETGLNEIEYEADGRRIRVGRGASPGPAAVASPPGATSAAPANGPAPAAPASAEAIPPGAVTSPMVGTVYVAPEPGGTPFVRAGDLVREGQTLLIIEAMKVMNPLASPRAGKVTQILVSDGQPVEYGEPLVVIE